MIKDQSLLVTSSENTLLINNMGLQPNQSHCVMQLEILKLPSVLYNRRLTRPQNGYMETEKELLRIFKTLKY